MSEKSNVDPDRALSHWIISVL